MAVLLPHALFWFSSLLLRIENPYTQWVWIANPDQRRGVENPLGRAHPLGRATTRSRTSAGSGQQHGMEHPPGLVKVKSNLAMENLLGIVLHTI